MIEMPGQRPKIGILIPSGLSPNIQVVLHNLGRMIDGVYRLQIIKAGGDDASDLADCYDVFSFGSWRSDPAGIGSSWRACYRYARQERPDLLMNVAKPQTLGWVVSSVARWQKIPSLIRMTGETFRQAKLTRTLYDRIKVVLLHDVLARRAYHKASAIATVGSHLRDALIAEGYDPRRVCVLPQPFDAGPFQEPYPTDKHELKSNLGLCPEKRTILFVGRLSWLKGADRLMTILRLLSARSAGYQFCVVGKGKYEAELGDFPQDIVHLAGEVSHYRMREYYQASDLMIIPSRTEGLPNALLEALAAGLPIIASPVGEIPQYVTTLVDTPQQFVKCIVESEWVRDTLPDNFKWEAQRKAYMELFELLIKWNPQRGSHASVEVDRP